MDVGKSPSASPPPCAAELDPAAVCGAVLTPPPFDPAGAEPPPPPCDCDCCPLAGGAEGFVSARDRM